MSLLIAILTISVATGCPPTLPEEGGENSSVLVPDVTNFNQEESREVLEASDLNLGEVVEVHDEEVPPGIVLAQEPPSAETVEPGTAISITVSLGQKSGITYYVSSSLGNDGNNGQSTALPFKTLAKGVSALTSGTSDHLLLRRGDVWNNEVLGGWLKSGISESEPMVIGAYGSSPDRPLVNTGTTRFIQISDPSFPVSHLTISGISFIAHQHTATNSAGDGFRILGPADNVTFEDCYIGNYGGNALDVFSGPISRFTLRRTIIADNFGVGGHSQGVYMSRVEGILIEDCILDHNGWNEPLNVSATKFNHNVYIQSDSSGLVFRRNISGRASSAGLMARAGGIVTDNVFVDNGFTMSYGVTHATIGPTPGGVEGEIRNNVLLDGRDITPGEPSGIGIEFGNINSNGLVMADNIIAHHASQGFAVAMAISGSHGVGVQNLTIERNIVYNWGVSMQIWGTRSYWGSFTVTDNDFQDPSSFYPSGFAGSPFRARELANFSGMDVIFDNNTWYSYAAPVAWFQFAFSSPQYTDFNGWLPRSGETNSAAAAVTYPDPGRSVDTYAASIGLTGTIDAFMEAIKSQSPQNWRPEFSAEAVIDYIKAGFGTGSPIQKPPPCLTCN